MYFLLSTLFLLSCKNNEPSEAEGDFSNFIPPTDTTINSTEPVYPFLDYVRDQLAMIDTIPYAIERVVTLNGITTDSIYVSKDVLKRDAQAFLEVDPNATNHRSNYIETSFNDLTLGLVTFSISAKSPEQTLQQADILVNPDNNRVKNLILRKQFAHADSSVQQMLLWKDKMNFQISEVITKSNNASYNRVLKVIWDKPLE
jgi:hypothetical protein